MLVSFFRNPIFARVVGIVAALAFLLPLIRYKHGLKIAVPLVMIDCDLSRCAKLSH